MLDEWFFFLCDLRDRLQCDVFAAAVAVTAAAPICCDVVALVGVGVVLLLVLEGRSVGQDLQGRVDQTLGDQDADSLDPALILPR